MGKFGPWVVKNRIKILIISTLLLIPAILGIIQTKINYDILEYLPKYLDSTKGQKILDKTFSNAATSMLIVESESEFEKLEIKKKVESVDGVSQVLWRDEIADVTIPENMLPKEIKDNFYSENSTLMFVKFSESPSSDKTITAIGKIRKLVGDKAYISGIPAISKDTRDLINKETPIYVTIAVLLSLLILILTQESFIIPILFLANIGYAILFNMGTNLFLGKISYLTKAIAAVLQLAVTMDYSIFLYHRYQEDREIYKDNKAAMGYAINETMKAITGSSLTTVAGFLALIVMQLTLGRDIGLVMAKGVVFGLITAITTLPAMILVMDGYIRKFQHKILIPDFSKPAKWITKHNKALLIVFILLFIPSVYGSMNTKVYYNLDRSLPRDLPSIISIEKMKKDYDMASTHFVLIRDDLEPYKSSELLNKIKNTNGVSVALAGSDLIGDMVPKEFIPEKIIENFEKGGYQVVLIQSKHSPATPLSNQQIDEINGFIKEYDKDAMITGEAVLTYDLTKTADRDFKVVNAVSIGIVFLIVVFVFKSISIPLLLVLAIELAIFINMGFPFYLNQTIPFVASIIIGTVQLGSTIDYSILLTSRYVEEIKNGQDKMSAMEKTLKETSKSVISSALAFTVGTLGVGFYSDMEIVSVLCKMMGRGALISMGVILILLPSVLLFCHKFIIKTTKDLKENEDIVTV